MSEMELGEEWVRGSNTAMSGWFLSNVLFENHSLFPNFAGRDEASWKIKVSSRFDGQCTKRENTNQMPIKIPPWVLFVTKFWVRRTLWGSKGRLEPKSSHGALGFEGCYQNNASAWGWPNAGHPALHKPLESERRRCNPQTLLHPHITAAGLAARCVPAKTVNLTALRTVMITPLFSGGRWRKAF